MGNVPTSGEDAYEFKFDIDHFVGYGSFAEVYKIKAKASGKFFAGKFFRRRIADMNSKDQLGIQRELKIMREVDHPFIVKFIEEFDYKQKNLCIVTKFAPGGDLEKYIQQQAKISEEDAL